MLDVAFGLQADIGGSPENVRSGPKAEKDLRRQRPMQL